VILVTVVLTTENVNDSPLSKKIGSVIKREKLDDGTPFLPFKTWKIVVSPPVASFKTTLIPSSEEEFSHFTAILFITICLSSVDSSPKCGFPVYGTLKVGENVAMPVPISKSSLNIDISTPYG